MSSEIEHKWIKSICTAANLHELSKILSDYIISLDEFDGHTIAFPDEDRENMFFEVVKLPEKFSVLETTYAKYHFPITEFGKSMVVLKKGTVMYYHWENNSKFSNNMKNHFQRMKLHSMAIVPILFGEGLSNELIGSISLFKQSEKVVEEDVKPIIEILKYFSPRLHSLQIIRCIGDNREKIRVAAKEQQRFLDFVLGINNLTAPKQIYSNFAGELFRRFNFDCFGIYFQNKEKDKLYCRYSFSKDMTDHRSIAWINFGKEYIYDIDPRSGALATSFCQDVHFYIPDVRQIVDLPMSDNDRAGIEAMDIPCSFLSMPVRDVRSSGKVIAVVLLWSLDEIANIDDQAISIIEKLCSFVITAVNNADLYKTVEEQNSEISESKKEIEKLYSDLERKADMLNVLATTDKLTGLKNFAYFQDELIRRINEYQRCAGESYLSIVILDIDHFKKFNDTYGHVSGNIALEEIASRVTKQARKMDIVCRYGGEEFVVILPKCDLEGAVGFAERVRKSIEENPVRTEIEAIQITASFGCAEYYPNEPENHFVERADSALYSAKENGRNRVEFNKSAQ
ncbi:MAG: GGDEF domain-containing protein [Gammaproteobacteria bacterium]|nr:MAG: GGDEF domain-containing protein [Gammaproteobacteria bacterium]